MTQSSERYVDRYRIDRKIGAGGMGVVHAAWDTVLDRPVAVKIMRDGLGDDETFQARFRREAETLARVRSRHIVQIYDYGTVGDQTYLVTELLDGGDLRARLDAHGPFPPALAAGLTAGVCDGLQDAHAAGVLHRDVKPSNVLVWERDDQLVPYLCDFGIATDDDNRLTRTGGVVGSLAYMAPERHLGEGGDARSDVYAAGCLLWTLLTGTPPYTGTDFQVASGHLGGPIPQVGLGTEAGAAIDDLLRAALAKDPGARIATAGELRDRLLALVPVTAGLPALTGVQPSAPAPVETRMRAAVLDERGDRGRASGHRPDGGSPGRTRRRRVALGLAALLVLSGGALAATRVLGDPSGPASAAGRRADSTIDPAPSSVASTGGSAPAGSATKRRRQHHVKGANGGAARRRASAAPLAPPGVPSIRALPVWKGVSFRIVPPTATDGTTVMLQRRQGSGWMASGDRQLVSTGFGGSACITVRALASSGARQSAGEPVTRCGVGLDPHVTLTRTGTCPSNDAEACLVYAVQVDQFPAGRSGLPLTLHEVSTTNGGTDASGFTVSTDGAGRGRAVIRTTSFKRIRVTYDGFTSGTVNTGTQSGDNPDPGGTQTLSP